MAKIYVCESLNKDATVAMAQFFAQMLNIPDDTVIRIGQCDFGSFDALGLCTEFRPEHVNVAHEADEEGGYVILFNAHPIAMVSRLATGDGEILAHEMMHVQQLASGRLEIDTKAEMLYWLGTAFPHRVDMPPWEVEAHAVQTPLYKLFLEYVRRSQESAA